MFSGSKFTKLQPKLTETGRVLALLNTTVKHNECQSCHFQHVDLNAPNSYVFFFSFRGDIIYTETSLKKEAWFTHDEASRIP